MTSGNPDHSGGGAFKLAASSRQTGAELAATAGRNKVPLATHDPDESGLLLFCGHFDSNPDVSNLSGGLGSVSTSPIVCRICYSTSGTLYAFCKCKGSVGYVHKDCLKRWIDAKLKANKCEICQAPFSGTDWSFKPINKWITPKMGVLDKLYLSLFICCTVIVLYSIPWITYKAWCSREAIFGDGPVTSERIFALIVLAIYVPLNISCVASLVVLWRRAVSGVCHRFIDVNKAWRVRITNEVAETKLINAINSTTKSQLEDTTKADDTALLGETDRTTPLKRSDRPLNARCSINASTDDATLLTSMEMSGDSSTMLIRGARLARATSSNTTLRSYGIEV